MQNIMFNIMGTPKKVYGTPVLQHILELLSIGPCTNHVMGAALNPGCLGLGVMYVYYVPFDFLMMLS